MSAMSAPASTASTLTALQLHGAASHRGVRSTVPALVGGYTAATSILGQYPEMSARNDYAKIIVRRFLKVSTGRCVVDAGVVTKICPTDSQ